MRGVFVLSLIAALSACQPIENKGDGSTDTTSSESYLQQAKTLATGSCSRTSDCLSVGIGARACGGPEDYLLFSKWDSASQIMDAVYNYNKAREKAVAGTIGTCEFLAPPSLVCSQNKCQKQETTGTEGVALRIVSGVLTLSPSNVTGALITFKAQNNTVTYYIRVSQLDFSARNQLETYRKTNTSVKLSVRIFALATDAPACEFINASCTTKVDVFDVRAIRILSVQ